MFKYRWWTTQLKVGPDCFPFKGWESHFTELRTLVHMSVSLSLYRCAIPASDSTAVEWEAHTHKDRGSKLSNVRFSTYEWKTNRTNFQLCRPPSILLPTIPVHLCESTITCLNLYSAISCCVSWVGAGDMRQCCRCQTKSGGGTLQNYCTATATAPVHQCSGGTLWCTEDAKLLHTSAQQRGERSMRAAIHCTTVRL